MSLYSAAFSHDGVQLGIDSNNANSCEQDLGVRNAGMLIVEFSDDRERIEPGNGQVHCCKNSMV